MVKSREKALEALAIDKKCNGNIKEFPRTNRSADDPLHAYFRLSPCRGPRVAIMMGKKYSQNRAEFRETGRVFDNQGTVSAVLVDNRQGNQQDCALSRLCDRCMNYWRFSHRRESAVTLVTTNFTRLLADLYTPP
jgi:hypothetical protein